MRDTDKGTFRGGEEKTSGDRGLWLVQKVAEGKHSYDLRWRVKAIFTRKKRRLLIVISWPGITVGFPS